MLGGRGQFCLRTRHRGPGATRQDRLRQHRLQLRRTAGQELQSLHVPRRRQQHDVHQDDRALAEGEEPDQGSALVLPDCRLRFRTRPLPRLVPVPGRKRWLEPRQRHGAHQHLRLQRLHPQNPPGQAGFRLPQSCRCRPDDFPEAVPRVQPALPAGRRCHGYRAVLGRGHRCLVGTLAELVVSRTDAARRRRFHQALQRQVRPAARQSGVGRLHGYAHSRPVNGRDQVHR